MKWLWESLQENEGKLLDLLHWLCLLSPQIRGGSGTEHSTVRDFWQQRNVWWRSGNLFHLRVCFRSMERRGKPKEKEEEELNRNAVSVLQSWSHMEGVCVYSAQLCQQKVGKEGPGEVYIKQLLEHSTNFFPKWVSEMSFWGQSQPWTAALSSFWEDILLHPKKCHKSLTSSFCPKYELKSNLIHVPLNQPLPCELPLSYLHFHEWVQN